MSADITCHKDEGVLVITLNRPAKKNAISASMYAALAQAVEQGNAEDDVRALLLRGAGGNFTSGNDIGLFVNADAVNGGAANGEAAQRPESPAMALIRAVLALRKPLVACVRGHAVGIGATVLLHCDYVVASDDARIRFPFVDLGLCPEFASTLLLPQAVGRGKATEWLLLGGSVPAGEACQAGLVNCVLPGDVAEEESLSVAKRLAAKPALALRATRELIREAAQDAAQLRVQRESTVFDSLRRSGEAQQIFRRFLERQPESAAVRG